jgi:hypothetical protein
MPLDPEELLAAEEAARREANDALLNAPLLGAFKVALGPGPVMWTVSFGLLALVITAMGSWIGGLGLAAAIAAAWALSPPRIRRFRIEPDGGVSVRDRGQWRRLAAAEVAEVRVAYRWLKGLDARGFDRRRLVIRPWIAVTAFSASGSGADVALASVALDHGPACVGQHPAAGALRTDAFAGDGAGAAGVVDTLSDQRAARAQRANLTRRAGLATAFEGSAG